MSAFWQPFRSTRKFGHFKLGVRFTKCENAKLHCQVALLTIQYSVMIPGDPEKGVPEVGGEIPPPPLVPWENNLFATSCMLTTTYTNQQSALFIQSKSTLQLLKGGM